MTTYLRKLKYPTLTLIAAGGFVGVSCMHLLLTNKMSEVAANQQFVVQAIELAKQQPELSKLLGSYQVGQPNFRDGWSRVEQDQIKLMFPLKGDKDSGQLFTYARRIRDQDPMRLCKIEARFNSIQNRKLILFELSEEQLRAISYQEKPETEKERLIRLRKEQKEELETKQRESKLIKFKKPDMVQFDQATNNKNDEPPKEVQPG